MENSVVYLTILQRQHDQLAHRLSTQQTLKIKTANQRFVKGTSVEKLSTHETME